MNKDFKVGDVVYLKSGSPALTVKRIDETKVLCAWFDKAESKVEGFEQEIITKVNPKFPPSNLTLI